MPDFRNLGIAYPGIKQRSRLSVDIDLVSPLYGGGVEPGQLDVVTPFRAASIRGQLRHWWRASKGAAFPDWERMHDAECAIWGNADRTSSVRVDVRVPDDWAVGRVRLRQYEHDLNRRYALFPPFNQRGVNLDSLERALLGAGSFTLTLSVADSTVRDDVEAALWAWVNFGGLGARTRRGAGSLFCSGYAGWNPKYVAGGGGVRPWPTLKGGTLILGQQKKGKTAWADAWVDVLQLYREFRQDRVSRGPTAWPEPNEIRSIRLDQEKPGAEGFPRGALGLPIVFHFKPGVRKEPSDQTLSVDKHLGRAREPEEGRMTSSVILKPFAMAKDVAYPMILVLNAPEQGQMYLFQKGATALPVSRGRRDAVAELILRAERKWGGSIAQL